MKRLLIVVFGLSIFALSAQAFPFKAPGEPIGPFVNVQ
jgi:hypothetical protein